MPGLHRAHLLRLTDCTTPTTVMIALDEPLREPSQRVRIDRRASAEPKARLRMSWALAGTAAPTVQMPENANKTKSMMTATAAHSG